MISNINQRKVRIKSVAEAYRIAKTHNTKIDEKQFIIEIMKKWGVTRRTAKEYILVGGSVDTFII